MNQSTLIFLVNASVRGVKIRHDPDEGKRDRLFKTLDPSVQKDDMVVIQTSTRYGMTVAKVEEVDVEVDVETTDQVNWIVQKVDNRAWQNLKASEDTMVSKINDAHKRKRREELANDLLANADVALLPLSDSGHGHTIEASDDYDTVASK